jgi:hypothetical protein
MIKDEHRKLLQKQKPNGTSHDSTQGTMQSQFGKKTKTYNSGYSLVVTHLTTNPPVRCLNRAERTGSLVFNVLWSYVSNWSRYKFYISGQCAAFLLLLVDKIQTEN